MNSIKRNYSMMGIFAVCFMMLIASFAMPVSATETQGITVQNGVYHASNIWNVTDNFIDVAFSTTGTNNVHNVTIEYRDYTATTFTIAKVVVPGFTTTSFSGNYIIPAIADGKYVVAFKIYTNASGSSSYTAQNSINQTVNVAFGGAIPYMPTGINSRTQFVDYMYFGATIIMLFAIFSLIRLKMYKSKDKIIEHEVLIMFASFILATVIWIFLGNPVGYIWTEISGFFTYIYNWFVSLWNAWL